MTSTSKSDLANFSGTTHYDLHSFNKAIVDTDGVQFLTKDAECYWLVDAIASHLVRPKFNQAATNDERSA